MIEERGPGKYDDLCSYVMREAHAHVAFVAVMGGNRGAGFSLQMTDTRFARDLPSVLEDIAAQMRQQIADHDARKAGHG